LFESGFLFEYAGSGKVFLEKCNVFSEGQIKMLETLPCGIRIKQSGYEFKKDIFHLSLVSLSSLQ